MDVVYERCAGLDIHRDTVVACRVTPEGRETRTFGTVTDELLALADWLAEAGVTHAAMESTGAYWKPLYNLLEGGELTLLLVNARHMRAVPGAQDRRARRRVELTRFCGHFMTRSTDPATADR